MRFDHSAEVNTTPEVAYRLCRDRLPEVLTGLENIDRVENWEREETDTGVKTVDDWRARGGIPQVVQAVIQPRMLRWSASVDWRDAEQLGAWRIKVRYFPQNVDCSGTIRFEVQRPGVCRMRMAGVLNIRLANIAMVPRALRSFVASRAEAFLIGMVPRNLEGAGRRLEELAADA